MQHAADSTIWILCPSVHSQELLYESLLNWQPDALFLPEAEFAAVENVLPDPEIAAERLAVLMQVGRGAGRHVIVATRASLDQAAPKHGALDSAVTQLQRGAVWKMESLLERLVGSGYERVAQVTTRGQFAVRGGIVDLYSWQALNAVPGGILRRRDRIPSRVRHRYADFSARFEVSRHFARPGALDQSSSGSRLRRARSPVIDIEPDMESGVSTPGRRASPLHTSRSAKAGLRLVRKISAVHSRIARSASLRSAIWCSPRRNGRSLFDRLQEWRRNNAKIVIYFQTEGEIERFREIMAAARSTVSTLSEGTLARGFCFPAANLVVLSAAELFGRFAAHPRRRLRRAERHRAQIDFSELNEGDLVVHLEHGIGRFLGLAKIPL